MAIAQILAYDPTRSISDNNNTPQGPASGSGRSPLVTVTKLFSIDLKSPAADNQWTANGVNIYPMSVTPPAGGKRSITLNAGFFPGQWQDLSVQQVEDLAPGFANFDLIFWDVESEIDYSHPNTNRNIAVFGYKIKQLKPSIMLSYWYNAATGPVITTATAELGFPYFRAGAIGQAYKECRPAEHLAAFNGNTFNMNAPNTQTYAEAGNQSVLQIWNVKTCGPGYDDPFFSLPQNQNVAQENDSTAAVGLGVINAILLWKKYSPNVKVLGFFWYCIERNLFTDYIFKTTLGDVRHPDKIVYPARPYEAIAFWSFFFGDGLYSWNGLGEVTTNADFWLKMAKMNDPWIQAEYLGNTPYNLADYAGINGYHLGKEGHIFDVMFRAVQMYSQVQDVCDTAPATYVPFEYRRESLDAAGVSSWSAWTAYTPPTNGGAAAKAMIDKVPFVCVKSNQTATVVASQDYWANVPYRAEVRLTVGSATETIQMTGNGIGVYRK